MKLIIGDVETTGLDNQKDRVIQYAAVTIDGEKRDQINEYFSSPVPIEISAMAVHHITEDDIKDKPTFTDWLKENRNLFDGVFIAHNASFDIGMLSAEGLEFPKVIDTLKIAKHLWPELESHSMQYLRYYHGIKVEGVAHDALGDVLVLEALFNLMLDSIDESTLPTNLDQTMLELKIDKLIELTNMPIKLLTMPFGKYKGQKFSEIKKINAGYIDWLKSNIAPDPENADLLYTIKNL